MAEKKRITLHGLFMNNRFVLAFSILTSVIIWVVVSMTVSPEDTRVVEHVKVTLEKDEESEYTVFGYDDTYVDVTVKGRRYLISTGALSADDITVTAVGNYVDYAGVQKLRLNAVINSGADIKITNLSKTSIDVYYDTEKTAIIPVEVRLSAVTDVVPEGYVYDDPIATMSNVTVTGPSSEINKIEKFVSVVNVEYPLTETTAYRAALEAVTMNGSEARYISFADNIDNFSVTVPVSLVKEIPITVRYVNIPPYYEKNMPEVNIYPGKIKVSAAKTVLDTLESLNIGTIDFNDLTNKNNKFTFSLDGIDEVRIVDKVKSVEVDVNCYPMSVKNFTVEGANITLLNVPDGLTAGTVKKALENVTIVGPKQELEKLNAEDIGAKVDLSEGTVGTKSYSAQVYIKNSEKCWAYGKYTIRVKIG